MHVRLVMVLGSLLLASGCVNSKTDAPIFVGGEHKVFFAAGEDVPEIPASANTNGVWVLRPEELAPMVTPL